MFTLWNSTMGTVPVGEGYTIEIWYREGWHTIRPKREPDWPEGAVDALGVKFHPVVPGDGKGVLHPVVSLPGVNGPALGGDHQTVAAGQLRVGPVGGVQHRVGGEPVFLEIWYREGWHTIRPKREPDWPLTLWEPGPGPWAGSSTV